MTEMQTRPLRHAAINVVEKSDGSPAPFVGLEDVAPDVGSLIASDLSEKSATDSLLALPGDVLFGKLRPYLSKSFAPAEPVTCTGEFLVLRPRSGLRSRYLLYLTLSRPWLDLANMTSYGSKMPRTSWAEMGGLEIYLPPTEEQDGVVRFLDRETAKIDALIAKQEQLIATLREDRIATITHAVTKGLDPNVEMRNSGIEWIGCIPGHWSVTAVKRVAGIFVPDRDKPELHETGELPWVTMENIGGRAPTPSALFVRQGDAVNRTASSGTVLASCIGRFGLASVLEADSVINQQLQGYIPSDRLDRYFLWYFVQQAGAYFDSVSTSTTLPYVNQQGFGNLPVTLPSPDEQKRIVYFLDRQTAKVAALIVKSQQFKEALGEYRSALITDAVTGKIDVRGVA